MQVGYTALSDGNRPQVDTPLDGAGFDHKFIQKQTRRGGMVRNMRVVENTGKYLFVQKTLDVLYLSIIVCEKNRELLELRDPSVRGFVTFPHVALSNPPHPSRDPQRYL